MPVTAFAIAAVSLLTTAVLLREYRRTTRKRRELLLALQANDRYTAESRTLFLLYITSSTAWAVGIVWLFLWLT